MARISAWMKRHPRITYLAYMVVIVFVLGEIGVRLFVRFDPSYYMARANPVPGEVVEYPYGTIVHNSDRFPDAEFDKVKTRGRVGYFGDSVCIGVGAGYGYRVSEVLEQALPEYEHLNLASGLGSDISTQASNKIVNLSERFDLDVVVYLMNLNDILPDSEKVALPGTTSRTRTLLDSLRGRSYLYTYVRYVVKNVAMRSGYNATGHQAYERFPEQYADIFAATASRVRTIDARLRERGVPFLIVLLPYEMQISQDAEDTYARMGIEWEDGFIDRGPQRKLIASLEGLNVIDAYYGFVDPQDPIGSRGKYAVGECFVYNHGDKIDFNHPNREGHRLIAEYVLRQAKLNELIHYNNANGGKSWHAP